MTNRLEYIRHLMETEEMDFREADDRYWADYMEARFDEERDEACN